MDVFYVVGLWIDALVNVIDYTSIASLDNSPGEEVGNSRYRVTTFFLPIPS
jgi:hypothetical protein